MMTVVESSPATQAVFRVESDDGRIYAIITHGGEEAARLFAAAPELLESLQVMTALAHAYVGDDPKGLALVAKATEAIFKAEGRIPAPGRAEQSPTEPQNPTEAKPL
jgi:hypothetical protein